MTKSRKYDPPRTSASDTAHLVASGALSVIPGAAELFEYFVTPPIEKRRDEWMEEVGNALQNLENNVGIKLDDLQKNDVFIDTVLQATQIAMRNSQREKKLALQNAIINAALPNSLEQSLQQMFLNWVDTFTVWHLQILVLFNNPRAWADENNHKFLENTFSSSLSDHILENAFPELDGKRAFYDQIWKDLYQRGLVNTEDLHTMMSSQGLMSGRTTELGKQFIGFIQKPINTEVV